MSSIAGTLENTGLSSEELGLLARIDPKLVAANSLGRDIKKGIIKRYRDANTPQEPKTGGWLQALLPIAGAVLPSIISMITGAITSRKKGTGARLAKCGMRGSGAAVRKVAREFYPEMVRMDKQLLKNVGNNFWGNLRTAAHRYATKILTKVHNKVPKNVMRALVSKRLDKVVPRALATTKIGKGIIPTGQGMAPYAALGMPMMYHVAKNLVQGKGAVGEVADELTRAFIEEASTMDGSGMQGGKFFQKLKKLAKSALQKALPFLKKKIPELAQYASSKIPGLIDRIFQWEPIARYDFTQAFKDPFKKLAQTGLEYGTKYGQRKLEEFAGEEDEPEIDEPPLRESATSRRRSKYETADVPEPEREPLEEEEPSTSAPPAVSSGYGRKACGKKKSTGKGAALPRGVKIRLM